MKAAILYFILVTISIFGCKSQNENEEKGNESSSETIVLEEATNEDEEYFEEANHLEYDPAQTLYFSHAFIYSYGDEGEEPEEFWLYHNPDTGQLMYMPDDPMIKFVVSDTLGNYYFFGNDGHGEQTIGSQFIEWVANPEFYDEKLSYPVSDQYVSLKPTGKTKSLEEYNNVDGKPIVGKEYKWEFSKLSGDQSTYITEIIPVNFYQVYGFNKLEGDIRLPAVGFDFSGIFGKNQVITKFTSGEFELELVSYQFNPAFVEAGDYQYSIQQADGTWKKEAFPLLSEK
ncbi:hypothetical protein [Aequorivita capsosiphonis]|uniref:hypothetical protein n=1 Tax=Aequorivita capsosiphonis TaxID=487317 RepID=UPI00042A89B7|nr:hypothetical protein [Aequorivita capsosiphonis]